MGASRWDETSYRNYDGRVRARTADPVLRDSTAHTADVRAGRAFGVHQLLNPHGVTMRESRDSEANPNSVAIAVFFDVTGSMGRIPVVLQRKLKTLMRTVIDRGYIADPHVFFGAIGDATIDEAPLQVGQFEANIQMDEDLSRMYLESGGGGNIHESYELAFYFAARHFSADCWEKRQHKGYIFTIGDELPYESVGIAQVRALCGETAQGPLSTEAIIAECEQKWNVFHILADTSTSRHHTEVGNRWRELLGNRVLAMNDPDAVAELIALTIGVCEGRVTPENGAQHLREMGVDEAAIAAIAQAVEPFARALILAD